MGDNLISWGDFEKVHLVVGTILEANVFEKARRPAYQLKIDFGEEIGVLKSSAQITHHYTVDDLINRQVVAVVNFPKKQIANFMSECLVTGFPDQDGHIVLTTVERKVPNGSRLI
ncbi:tRNA-binding protein [Sphingobacterium sp. UT-1RO-CII-1]|uniref:tRNA-binding protein n=1 Tax=Sphingobacterium sp. UT-1RO-CII-1 TaxID=2995225 RepID=UPI00227BB850|nr:tRNA-binding protein [Sphingobacterium sp. UT-1RO-CII-1]MCY4781135.1 tRNA-binding protein [Sphingobacterium sp. UT-1RO-CII-1]